MDALLFRVGKSIALALLMYFSLKYLGIEKEAAIIASSIPLVLGVVGVMTGTAYIIAASVFILAALSALLPPRYQNGMDFVNKVVADVSASHGQNTPVDKQVASGKSETPAKAKN